MSDLRPRFQLEKLLELADGFDPYQVTISKTTALLCIDLLTRWPSQRWAWTNNGLPLTDDEFKISSEIVNRACAELTEV